MNIGFDLDYTLGMPRIDYWTLAAENLGIKEEVEPPKSWGFPEYSDRLSEECKRLFRMNWYMNDLLYFNIHAGYVISQCCMAGHQVFIITARHEEIRQGTMRQIRKAFGNMISHTLFADPKYSKINEFRDAKLDVWIDDKPKDLHVAVELGINSLVLDRPWNRKLIPETSNQIHRADDLNGVLKYLNILPEFNKSRKV